jgi:hypothetical protein
MEVSTVMPPTIGDGADRNSRNAEDAYHRVEGQVSGRIKLVTGWHAIGHPVGSSRLLTPMKLTFE